nr:uncharacterized protein LOC108174798 [Malus domestica]
MDSTPINWEALDAIVIDFRQIGEANQRRRLRLYDVAFPFLFLFPLLYLLVVVPLEIDHSSDHANAGTLVFLPLLLISTTRRTQEPSGEFLQFLQLGFWDEIDSGISPVRLWVSMNFPNTSGRFTANRRYKNVHLVFYFIFIPRLESRGLFYNRPEL